MIQGQCGTGCTAAYIQSGYTRLNGTEDQYFWQLQPANGQTVTDYGAYIDYNSSNHFWQRYTQSCNCVESFINSDNPSNMKLLESQVNGGWNVVAPEVFGEADFLSTDMPGTSSAPTQFLQIQFQTGTSWNGGTNLGTEVPYNDSGATDSGTYDGHACALEHRWGYHDKLSTSNEFDIYANTTGYGTC